jgi:hypothetical protein
MGIYKVVKNDRELYRARITVGGKRKSLGYHKTKELAEQAIATEKNRNAHAEREQQWKSGVTPIIVGTSITAAPPLFKKEDIERAVNNGSAHFTFNDKLVAKPFVITKPSLLTSIKRLFHK